MKLTMHTTLLLSPLLALPLLHTHAQSTNATYLTAPALVTVDNRTVIQCWRLTSPFVTSSTPGTVGAQAAVVGNATNLAYTVLPPRFNGGLHTAPVPQLVHFLSGLAHVTLPNDTTQDLWLVGGPGGLVFATDTTGPGHITTYPSDQQTVGIVAPFEGARVPGYEVLREGGCEGEQSFV
ncbi:small secreted protein [Stagonosporopsis vannaccii]|nr:small secreted protein [Stagonosporopsis vannaccii]